MVRVGVSGYDYPEWRGTFYPSELPRRRWLRHAAEHFGSIELNGTFYSLKSPATYARWAAEVPASFPFAVKGSGFITHRLRLKRPVRALANFYASGVLALGRHTGPFLWQLPPNLRFDRERMEEFLAALPDDSDAAERLARRHDARLPARARLRAAESTRYRHAFEVRDASFCVEAFYDLLRAKGAALVLSDTGGRFPTVEEHTADFMYLRLHGPRELYASGYTERELAAWAERVRAACARGEDVFAYFDNNVRSHAPRDATELTRQLTSPRSPRRRTGCTSPPSPPP